jgi:sugar-phosphatase
VLRVDAVLFDMDGTLVDSDAAVARAWRQWAGEFGVDPELAVTITSGIPAATSVVRLRPDLDTAGVAAAAARQLALQYEDLVDVTAMPGAHDLLDLLAARDLPWAIVTSADRGLARARLGAARISAPLVVSVEDVAKGKPAPDGYLRAAHVLGVDPERCLVVEDSDAGLAAGRAAGAMTAGLRGLSADVELTDLAELAALLAVTDG